MRESFIDAAKKKLISRFEELEKRRKVLAQHVVELADHHEPDASDAASANASCVMLESLSERELYELRDISDAIDRIRSGEFGICIECSAEIAEGRLAAYPSVSTCTACAREHEQEDRRRKMLSTI